MIFWLLSGCAKPDGREIAIPIQAHSLPNCPLPSPARLDLAALGDFPVSNRTSESLAVDASGVRLGFPQNTLALEATANADLGQAPFIGYSELISQRLDFVLWPRGVGCDIFRPASSDSFPGQLGGEALGYSNANGLVMIAGSNDATSAAIVGALTFDTHSGQSYVVDPRKRQVLSEPRAFATVSDFAGKLLVAGGENPIHDPAQLASQLRDSAEVYDPATQSFEPDLIGLADATTHHAATTLDNGETVLVGGRNEISNASNVVQVVSPVTRVSKLLEPLAVGRNAPIALHLDDGRLLVAGGDDEGGHPVGALEWRDVDASRLQAPFDGSTALPARFDRAFVALPGGAALGVGGCEDRAPEPGEDCSACNRGCPPTPDPDTQQRYDAFWLGSDGSVTKLDFTHQAPAPILVQGSDGRPWMIATAEDDSGTPLAHDLGLYRFDPWQKRFEAVDLDLGFNETLTRSRMIATGPDAFVWLGADASGTVVRGARIGTRSSFVSDVPLVSLPDGASRPAHLAPDHVPDDTVSYDAATGALSLSVLTRGATPNCVWIADARYSDFSAQISFSSSTPPSLRFGTQRITDPNSPDSTPCRLPAATLTSAGGQLDFRRTGAAITIRIGNTDSSCELADESARLPFAICQSELGDVRVTELAVTRGD